ncbi:unnamed protein product [Lactuca saligna]|uniref:Uncharacterized protein n=1 Tax=Lactuca saligna TaxID=75948 RepID=A0AA36A5L9_LACSI|nr:unnamed protein product [Lactuca saligna]
MFGRNPIRYTDRITQRFSDIDFATMEKDGCVAFIERFNGEMYHFGNSNIQEWLDEHKDDVVGNIDEEVLDGAGLVKEVATGHRDVGDIDDEEENGDEDDDEDEDADDDEDDHLKCHTPELDVGNVRGLVRDFIL